MRALPAANGNLPCKMIDCLDQGTYWQDDDGSWLPIHNMPIGRALRLLGGLEIRVASLSLEQTIRTSAALMARMPEGSMPDEQLAADIEASVTAARERQADPCGWLRGTPFYRAIATRIMSEIGWTGS